MEIISIGSSSSGNSYIIKAAGRAIILDVGLSCKAIMAALETEGIEPDDVAAVLVTHEHVDHVKSVRAVSRKCSKAIFYASRGTIESAAAFSYVPEERLIFISAGESFTIESTDDQGGGNITITAFELSHDALEPIGYTIEADGEKLAVITDTGIIKDDTYEAISDSDQLVFEANHDVDMLMFGEYPYPVKVRIKGDKGHLSNDYAADALSQIIRDRKERGGMQGGNGVKPLRIMLAHLSFHNNAPLFARQTVEDRLGADGFRPGEDYLLEVAMKEGLTYMPQGKDEETC
jgi:phosphoribosyl 1,2-cyclic phosphodiesterase